MVNTYSSVYNNLSILAARKIFESETPKGFKLLNRYKLQNTDGFWKVVLKYEKIV